MNFWLKDIIIYLRDSSLHNELMKMKTKHMRKRISYFKALRGLPKNELKKYIATCEDQLIHVICEACFNLCHHHALKDDTEKEPLQILPFLSDTSKGSSITLRRLMRFSSSSSIVSSQALQYFPSIEFELLCTNHRENV